jgi:phage shock protein A
MSTCDNAHTIEGQSQNEPTALLADSTGQVVPGFDKFAQRHLQQEQRLKESASEASEILARLDPARLYLDESIHHLIRENIKQFEAEDAATEATQLQKPETYLGNCSIEKPR